MEQPPMPPPSLEAERAALGRDAARLILAACALAGTGLVLVFAAGVGAETLGWPKPLRQGLWLAVGFVSLAACALIPPAAGTCAPGS